MAKTKKAGSVESVSISGNGIEPQTQTVGNAVGISVVPVEEKLTLWIEHPLQGGRSVIRFEGKWSNKEVNIILRAIPRAYRLHQLQRRKQGEARFE